MSIYQLLFELYENGQIVFGEGESIALSDQAFGAAALASGAIDPTCLEAVHTLSKRLADSVAMACLRKHHEASQEAKAAKSNYGADLKPALRIH